MPRFLWLVIMMAALSFLGCNSSEQPGSQTAPVEKKSSVAEQPPSTEEGKGTAAVAPANDAVEQAKENVKESTEQTSAITSPAVVEPAKSAEPPVEMGVKPTEAMPGEAAKQSDAAPAAASTTAVAKETATEAAIPEEIILKASNGNVTFPHRMHAETHECQTCHGDGAPSAFGINKDIAHKLCRDCHKSVGAGPTSCNGCHKK